nr:MAG TPA: hypothetical protein [Herelleviridae sp.]
MLQFTQLEKSMNKRGFKTERSKDLLGYDVLHISDSVEASICQSDEHFPLYYLEIDGKVSYIKTQKEAGERIKVKNRIKKRG